MRNQLALAGVALLWGCSAPPTQHAAAARSASATPRVASASASASAAPPVEPPCTADARPPKGSIQRAKGVTLLAQGKSAEALKAFDLALDETPSDVAAFAMHAVAEADLAATRAEATRAFLKLKPLRVEPSAPPYKLLIKADKAGSLSLKKLGDERSSGDWFAWLPTVGLETPLGFGGSDDLPVGFSDTLGDQPMFASYHHGTFDVARYGPGALVLGKEALGLRAVQLDTQLVEAFRASMVGKSIPPESVFPEVRFADVIGSTLVVELAHEGNGPQLKPDGLLVAIDLELDKVRWISDPQTANAYTFFSTGSHVVTTFSEGVTAKLGVFDLATGEVVAKETIAGRVDYVVGSGSTVYAWGSEKVTRFELSSAPPRAALKLGKVIKEEPRARATPSAAQSCWLENAVVALDHRDPAALRTAADNLKQGTGAEKILHAALDFLSARAQGTAGLDLTERQPSPVSFVEGPLVRADGPKAPNVTKRAVPAKDPVVSPPKAPFPEGPRPLYATQRYDIYPQRYGTGGIHGAFNTGQKTVLVYGNRYVVEVEKDEVKNIFDLLPLLGSAAKGAKTATNFLTVIDGTIYGLVTPSTSYSGAPGAAAYIFAMDPATGKVLWRTAAGVVTSPFLVFGEALLTVQTAAGRSSLVLHRLADGRVLQTLPFSESATHFGWDSRGVVVVTFASQKKQYFQVK